MDYCLSDHSRMYISTACSLSDDEVLENKRVAAIAIGLMFIGVALFYESLNFLLTTAPVEKAKHDMDTTTTSDYTIKVNFFGKSKENLWYRNYLNAKKRVKEGKNLT